MEEGDRTAFAIGSSAFLDLCLGGIFKNEINLKCIPTALFLIPFLALPQSPPLVSLEEEHREYSAVAYSSPLSLCLFLSRKLTPP